MAAAADVKGKGAAKGDKQEEKAAVVTNALQEMDINDLCAEIEGGKGGGKGGGGGGRGGKKKKKKGGRGRG